jgi:hypothetical protein
MEWVKGVLMSIGFLDFVHKLYQRGYEHAKIAFSTKETKVAAKALFQGETKENLSLFGRLKHIGAALAFWLPPANIITHIFTSRISEQLPSKKIDQSTNPHPMELRSHVKVIEVPKIVEKSIEADVNIEEIEIFFWEIFTEDPELQRVLQLEMAHGSGNDTEKAEYLITCFESFTGQSYSPTIISQLTDRIKAQLATNEHAVTGARGPEQKVLETGETLTIYDTVGDGSCGLHALLGEADEDGTYATDAESARLELRAWISKNFTHPRIDNVLDDYFTHFDIAPDAFKTAVEQIYTKARKRYDTLSIEDQTARKESFKKNPHVRKAYLDNLQKVGTYLLQDELIAAAVCFQKKLVFHQPQHGKSGHAVGSYEIDETKDFSGPTAHIWYNGYNHYEKAAIS